MPEDEKQRGAQPQAEGHDLRLRSTGGLGVERVAVAGLVAEELKKAVF